MLNELAFNNRDAALKVAELLLDNDYVVMLSTEDTLTILNYEWSEHGDRNDVVFMNIEQYVQDIEEMCKDCKSEEACDACCKN